LPPNNKIILFLTSLLENFEDKIKKSFEIKVNYENSHGESLEDIYIIDFSFLNGISQLGEPPLIKIAKNVEDIKRDINHLSTGYSKIRVICFKETS